MGAGHFSLFLLERLSAPFAEIRKMNEADGLRLE